MARPVDFQSPLADSCVQHYFSCILFEFAERLRQLQIALAKSLTYLCETTKEFKDQDALILRDLGNLDDDTQLVMGGLASIPLPSELYRQAKTLLKKQREELLLNSKSLKEQWSIGDHNARKTLVANVVVALESCLIIDKLLELAEGHKERGAYSAELEDDDLEVVSEVPEAYLSTDRQWQILIDQGITKPTGSKAASQELEQIISNARENRLLHRQPWRRCRKKQGAGYAILVFQEDFLTYIEILGMARKRASVRSISGEVIARSWKICKECRFLRPEHVASNLLDCPRCKTSTHFEPLRRSPIRVLECTWPSCEMRWQLETPHASCDGHPNGKRHPVRYLQRVEWHPSELPPAFRNLKGSREPE